jgi:hypothetical protein
VGFSIQRGFLRGVVVDQDCLNRGSLLPVRIVRSWPTMCEVDFSGWV